MNDDELNLNKRVGKKFKDLRAQVGLDQKHVANLLDIPRSAVSVIESGERHLSVYEFDLLCRLLRVSPNEILGWNRSQVKERVTK